jgi:hypothetical protein
MMIVKENRRFVLKYWIEIVALYNNPMRLNNGILEELLHEIESVSCCLSAYESYIDYFTWSE